MGKVTVVEVGDIKRDIAYHGDTLNTAARIQSVCGQYDRRFLTSASFWAKTGLESYFDFELIGMVPLKGKSNPVGIASISKLNSLKKNSPETWARMFPLLESDIHPIPSGSSNKLYSAATGS